MMGPDGFLERTLPRDHVFCSATPQTFAVDLYRVAVYTAKTDGSDVTDDNMLMEHIGQAVKAVVLESDNRKLRRKRISCMRRPY
jgi:2-C-methyl-D-erythritol 4-phosphate cytidylyltransferase